MSDMFALSRDRQACNQAWTCWPRKSPSAPPFSLACPFLNECTGSACILSCRVHHNKQVSENMYLLYVNLLLPSICIVEAINDCTCKYKKKSICVSRTEGSWQKIHCVYKIDKSSGGGRTGKVNCGQTRNMRQ